MSLDPNLVFRYPALPITRPKVPLEIRQLIRNMSLANPICGAPRIHGELLKLGINVLISATSGGLAKLD
jgi:hypothetical protein